MKTIRAFGCTRRAEDRSAGLSTAVCLVLDPAHAQHTMRVFKRDQRPGGVVHDLPEGEANRLLSQEPDRIAAQMPEDLAATG